MMAAVQHADDLQRTRRTLGSVYTPPLLATWLAGELARRLPSRDRLRILDPACGEGVLLRAVLDATDQPLTVAGIDRDGRALQRARTVLPADALLVQADALTLPRFGLNDQATPQRDNGRPNAVIANPPWGAEVPHSRAALQAAHFTLAQGQFDSFELFIELSLGLVEESGVLAFIIPDAVFLPEHRALRRLLVDTTQLLLIARLGEGFFDGVYRGTTILVCRRARAPDDHTVRCFRLDKQWRKRVLAGAATLEQAQARLAHDVPQQHFARDPEARFDIDLRRQEHSIVKRLEQASLPWRRWLVTGRGVEISKYGAVLCCPHCGVGTPAPRQPRLLQCAGCARPFRSESARRERIVRADGSPDPNWRPLIAGEDVERYRCHPSRQIRLGVPGINYKTPETFAARKLLVRKTGVGLKAAIDDSGAYTTQVVFHYSVPPRLPAPPFLLDYLLGVLCSRVMLAYHLKRWGENEWRSHPYVTQRILSALPVPDLAPGAWQWRQAQAIATAVDARRRVNRHDGDEDLAVERLVAGLYGLTDADCAWVLQVLEDAEALEPIRTLRLSDPRLLRPVLAQ